MKNCFFVAWILFTFALCAHTVLTITKPFGPKETYYPVLMEGKGPPVDITGIIVRHERDGNRVIIQTKKVDLALPHNTEFTISSQLVEAEDLIVQCQEKKIKRAWLFESGRKPHLVLTRD